MKSASGLSALLHH